MDPTIPPRPKHWRRFGRIGLLLLVAAVVTAAGGWLASVQGHDPDAAYRMAAMLCAGAVVFGLVWAGSSGMGDTTDRR